MYQIYFDGYPIYDPRDDELIVREPDVHLAVGEAGEMSFIIDPDHPHAWVLSKLRGTLELRADGTPIFKGRITKDTRDFSLSRTIEAEGLLACLNDSLIPPHSFPDDWRNDAAYQAAQANGNVIAFYLGWLLEQHNAQTGPAQQILLGDVTITDPNNYILRESSDYVTTMETVRSKLEELLGGYLLVDYSGETPVLNYYADLPFVNTQTVEFGENLLSLLDEADAAETYTAILPLGQDGLTIAELDDGEISPGFVKEGPLIYSVAAEETYNARIIRRAEWKDVLVASNLQTRALTALQEGSAVFNQTITVRAVDLGGAQGEECRATAIAGEAIPGRCMVGSDRSALGIPGGGVSRFIVGRYVEIKSTPHGFNAVWPLMELNPDILDPGNTEITLGATVKSASSMARSSYAATQERLASQQLALVTAQEAIAQQQAVLAQTASDLDEVPQTLQAAVTTAVQTSESIVFSALERYVETSNFEEFQQTIDAQFAFLANELVLRFTEATDQTKLVDDDLQRTLETISKYFEFGQDGLTIRAGENAMELALDNDLVLFRRNGQQFGWWDGVDFHTGNIVIGVTERAQFGSFAFVPRANGLSFLEVGE